MECKILPSADEDATNDTSATTTTSGKCSISVNSDSGSGSKATFTLGEDELSLILNQSSLSTKDLFRCRLVNSLWLHVSTLTILQKKQSGSSVWLVLDKSLKEAQAKPVFLNARSKSERSYCLGDLTQLMSTSRNFPTSVLRLQYSSSIRSDYDPLPDPDPDLPTFFEQHGSKIKALFLDGPVSMNQLEDLLFTCCLNLQILDLSNGEFSSSDHPSFKDLALHLKRNTQKSKIANSPILSLKTLHLCSKFIEEDENNCKILKLLLHTPSKLSCIKNVSNFALAEIRKHGKVSFITSLNFDTSDLSRLEQFEPNQLLAMEELIKFQRTQTTPKNVVTLSKLLVDRSRSDEDPNLDPLSPIVTSLNCLIQSCKDTLEKLEICVDTSDRYTMLRIPPMKKLKTIILCAGIKPFRNVEEPPEMVPENGFVFAFEKEIMASQYFPSLQHVVLIDVDAFDTFLQFFLLNFYSGAGTGTWPTQARASNVLDTVDKTVTGVDRLSMPTVEKITIGMDVWSNMFEAKLISKVFPYVRHLKVKCKTQGRCLKNSLWVLCPLAETVEIYGISKFNQETNEDVEYIDQFFTGFSLDMCAKLRENKLPHVMENEESIRFLRVKPSICDLSRLKELKLRFARMMGPGQFSSHVSGEFAFRKMPKVNIAISYDRSEICKGEDKDDPKAYFASIAPYVQFIED